MGRGRNLPTTEQEIRVYWADILTRKYPQKFTSSANILDAGECFACGVQVNPLHRAHIVARVSGGSDAADNLHMLCAVCHKDSERLEGGEYWRWFAERTLPDMALSLIVRSGGANLWSELVKSEAAGVFRHAASKR